MDFPFHIASIAGAASVSAGIIRFMLPSTAAMRGARVTNHP